MLVLFGYAIVLDVRDVGVAVLDLDHSVASRELVELLTADQAISVAARPASTREMDHLLDAGRVRLGIVIPPAYGEDLKAGKTVPVQVLVDGTDATFAGLALGQVGGSLRYQVTRELEATLRQLGRPGELPGLHAKPRVFFNETLNGTWFIIPGLIAIIVMLLAALVTSQCVAREYEQNTIEQILVSPVSGPALMLGKLIPYVGVGCLQVLSVTVASRLLFQVPIRGSLLLLAGATLLFLLGSMALGLMLSATLKSQQLAMMVAFIATMLPSLILSGFIFPLENMPGWLQAISYAVPARYYVVITRGLFLKGVGIEVLWPELLAMVIFAFVLIAVSSSRFRRTLG
ncbi:MAG: ABC transporter permease [Deltaproteobacteria bacterium]|nr:ABC transporter permease [Deltaproteobacteria bacterium]